MWHATWLSFFCCAVLMPLMPKAGPPSEARAPAKYRYAAFISYRHVEPDRRWAKRLHSMLENYRVPRKLMRDRGLPRRVGRIFRDEEELPASSELKAEIDTALKQSRFLIVVCSPRVVQSRWCNEEIRRFRELGRHHRILALLIEGEPSASFPPALREIRRTITDAQGLAREQIEEVEPLAADVRPERKENKGHVGRMAKLRLLACLLGVRFDDLRQREHERRTRRLALAGVVMASLLCILASLTVFALIQRTRAIHQTARAEANEARANEETKRAQKSEADALRQKAIAVEQSRATQVQMAQTLIAQGDLLASAGRWGEAKSPYLESREMLARLGEPPFLADLGLWAKNAGCPPPLNGFERPVTGDRQPWMPCVAISPDGRRALSGDHSSNLHLWDLLRGRELRDFKGRGQAVLCVAFSPDGRRALAGNMDGTLTLWDLDRGRELRALTGQGSPISCIAFFRDGRTAVAGSGTLRLQSEFPLNIWNLETGQVIRKLGKHAGGLNTVAISPDGSAVAVACGPKLTVFDPEDGRELHTVALGARITRVTFSDDGQTIWAAAGNGTVKSWSGSGAKELRSVELSVPRMWCAAFAPNARAIFGNSGGDDQLTLWDLADGHVLRRFSTSDPPASGSFRPMPYAESAGAPAISADGRMALTATATGTMQLWDANGARESVELIGHERQAGTGSISPDGRTALTGGADGTARLWDTATGRQLRILRGHAGSVACAIFSADGARALTGGGIASSAQTLIDCSLRLWDLATGREIRSFAGHARRVLCISFCSGERTAVSVSEDGVIKLWDVASGKELDTRQVSAGLLHAAISNDGARVLTGVDRNGLTMWETSGSSIRLMKDYGRQHGFAIGFAFSPDAATFVACEAGSGLRARKSADGEVISQFVPGRLSSQIAISPDGKLALCNGVDRPLRLWDIASGRALSEFPRGEEAYPSGQCFSNDGTRVLLVRSSKPPMIWDVSRSQKYVEFLPLVQNANKTLQQSPDDPASLAVLGRWDAFRGVNDWAAELLEQARARGAEISPLDLARVYWQLDKPDKAAREFQRAVDTAHDAAEKFYLSLCLTAVQSKNGPPATPNPGSH